MTAKISDLTAAASAASTDLYEIETAGGASKKATAAQILAYIEGAIGTAAFRALIDDTDAAAMRTTLSAAASTHTHAAGDVTSGSLALARGGTAASLADPNADRIMFWDDSAGAVDWLTAGTGLTISGTTISASGQSPARYPIDQTTLHATYGDDFAASSLDAKWTRHNLSSSDESYQVEDGSHMMVYLYGGSADKLYYQTAPAGDFELVVSLTYYSGANTFVGPFVVDSSGNGVTFTAYSDNNAYMWKLASWVYDTNPSLANVGNNQGIGSFFGPQGNRIWLALNKTGTAYKGRISTDGKNWSAYSGTTTQTFTVASIGFGRMYSPSSGAAWMRVDRFDLV